ncbi:hypothetical protein TCAL_11956 [Tigriopus californicus]|uniref:Cullin-2 n=1 Tax=Tigriopus californicus TaxID=6832 RepID=A0A553PPN3_TIGCA|nr:cullin-2-like [Tigriopus californicus]TRY79639.1 hypothetical protein TCAL_11956 [Tigriopus californicus]|eukprot:TCALIF_11956-PA protein Name:"Similar to Cul2 Cullin-2 (Mus musculus)" AED:0.09 eAED:0.09 QI:271/1/0.90/1/1/1/11/229/750
MSLKPKRVDFTQTWSNLKETMTGVIMFSNVPRAVWNDRFTDVYSLCVAYPEPLADRLYSETKAFLEDHVQTLKIKVKKGGERELLKDYYEAWTKFSQGIDYLHKLFSYLNNQHIRKQKMSDAELTYGSLSIDHSEQMKEIGELGLETWKKLMIEPMKDQLVSLLLDGIRYDRLGETGSTGSTQFQSDNVIKGVINSFVSVEEYKKKGNLELYEDIFEKPFLTATGDYYREEAQNLLQEGSISLYMQRVIQKIESENMRSRKFLYPGSYQKVTSECEQRMVGDHISFLHSECKSMVERELRTDLANMYLLLKPIVGAQKVLLDEIQNHIKSQGLKVISALQGEAPSTEFVENVLDVHQKYREMISATFQGDLSFIGAMDKAMTAIINHRAPKMASKSPELLAKYCDSLLKKSQKGISENEIDEKLSKSITVFKYLDDKDVFQKFYSRNLGKRLIHQQSHSMDLEEAMINRLKQACGYEFTNKFHRMFTDISVAEDLNSKFTDYLNDNTVNVGINYFVRVLQQGAWPMSHTGLLPLNIPQELERTVQAYEKFYAKQFNGRKLTWLHHLSNGDVKLGYLNKSYIVNMSTFQMALLLLFEKSESLSYDELRETTNIQAEAFPRHVQSLLDSKLLLCNTEELTATSVISLNMKYSNKRTKFRIAGTVQRETPQEVEQTHQAVDEDRKMYLQAAIVRIMKSRKVLKHNLLIQEVISQSKSRFTPSIPMIKKVIENLIDKAYIERTKNSSDEYAYMA